MEDFKVDQTNRSTHGEHWSEVNAIRMSTFFSFQLFVLDWLSVEDCRCIRAEQFQGKQRLHFVVSGHGRWWIFKMVRNYLGSVPHVFWPLRTQLLTRTGLTWNHAEPQHINTRLWKTENLAQIMESRNTHERGAIEHRLNLMSVWHLSVTNNNGIYLRWEIVS